MATTAFRYTDDDARELLDRAGFHAEAIGSATAADELEVTHVRAERDEEGGARVLASVTKLPMLEATITPTQLPLPGLSAIAHVQGTGPNKTVAIYSAPSRDGRRSPTLAIALDRLDLKVLNRLMGPSEEIVFVEGALQQTQRKLGDEMAERRAAEHRVAALEAELVRERAAAQEAEARFRETEDQLATITRQNELLSARSRS